MPDKIHMTVPSSFRRHSEIPEVIVLHHGKIIPREIEEREGYGVTKPIRTIVDLVMEESVSIDSIQQAYKEAKKRGLITEDEFKRYKRNPAINRKLKESLVGIA